MAKLDSGKRDQWQKNLERFEASGLTVAQFCRNEEISPATYYYWARRLRPASQRGQSASGRARQGRRGSDAAAHGAVTTERTDAVRSVRIACGSGLQVSVPADGLEAIRCVLEWASQRGLEAGDARARFQEVVLAESGAAS